MLKVACSGPGVSRTRNLSVTSPIRYTNWTIAVCDVMQVNTLYSNNDGRGREARGRVDQNDQQSKPVSFPPVNSSGNRSTTKTNLPWRPPGPTHSAGFGQSEYADGLAKHYICNTLFETCGNSNFSLSQNHFQV